MPKRSRTRAAAALVSGVAAAWAQPARASRVRGRWGGRPGAGDPARRHLGLEARRQEGPKQLAKAEKEAEAHPRGHQPAQQAPRQPLVPGARHGGLDGGAADIDQTAIAHAGGAGRLAGAAGQTAIQMELGLAAGGLAFQDLLDQIDAAPGSVQFIAQELVGGTGGGAETAVHTGPQDGVRLLALVTVADKIGQLGLHTYKSG